MSIFLIYFLSIALIFSCDASCDFQLSFLAPQQSALEEFIDQTNKYPSLAGKNIIRFMMSDYDQTGGLQQYCKSMDQEILDNNNTTIYQIYYTDNPGNTENQKINFKKGSLIKVPVLKPYKLKVNDKDSPESFYQKVKKIVSRLGIKPVLHTILNWPVFSHILVKFPVIKKYYHGEAVNNRDLLKKLQDILDHSKIDLVVLHSLTNTDSYTFAKECNKSDIPVILQHHGDNQLLKHPVSRKIIPLSQSKVALVNPYNIPGFLKNNSINLSDGIDTDFYSPEYNINTKENNIVLAASITGSKGHAEMIKVALILKKKNIKCKFIFAGKEAVPELAVDLKKQIQKLGLDDYFHFTGPLTQFELREQYAKSKLLVLPSHSEGLGRVLLEAQSMKIPVIGSDTGGIPDAMIPGETGLLLKINDIVGWAEQIEKLLKQNQRREAMGEKGREFVLQQYSLQALIKRHIKLYQKAFNNQQKVLSLPIKTADFIKQAA